MDDLEEYWKAVVPPRDVAAKEEKPITFGHLWLAPRGDLWEEPLARVLVRVPEGQEMNFQADFAYPPSGKTEGIYISGGALWLAKRGGKPVYAKAVPPSILHPGDVVTLKISITDSGNEYISFRKLLQVYGVL